MLYMFGCQHLLGLTCICNQMHVWEVLFACHGSAELSVSLCNTHQMHVYGG